jgi:hypothetical protein
VNCCERSVRGRFSAEALRPIRHSTARRQAEAPSCKYIQRVLLILFRLARNLSWKLYRLTSLRPPGNLKSPCSPAFQLTLFRWRVSQYRVASSEQDSEFPIVFIGACCNSCLQIITYCVRRSSVAANGVNCLTLFTFFLIP